MRRSENPLYFLFATNSAVGERTGVRYRNLCPCFVQDRISGLATSGSRSHFTLVVAGQPKAVEKAQPCSDVCPIHTTESLEGLRENRESDMHTQHAAHTGVFAFRSASARRACVHRLFYVRHQQFAQSLLMNKTKRVRIVLSRDCTKHRSRTSDYRNMCSTQHVRRSVNSGIHLLGRRSLAGECNRNLSPKR